MEIRDYSGTLLHNLIIVLVAGFLCLPLLIHGVPATGASSTHAMYQYNFSRQFWNGEFYPRWLINANRGYGSPIFLIQYPLPYWITALLRPVTRFQPTPAREARELGVFCFLILTAAGFSARFWFQKRRTPFAATAGAIVYISLPYLLAFNLYQHVAIGQLATLAWMPLAFAACESLQLRFTPICALGIVWALLVLSNLLIAMLFVPLMVWYAVRCREPHHVSLVTCIVSVLISLATGTCLAAVYIFPFIAYRRLFDIKAMSLNVPDFEFSHSFSFVRLASLGRPLVLMALVGALIVVVIAAHSSWRAYGSVASRVCMLLTLGLGVLMITPGLGLRLVGLSGLRATGFEALPGDTYFPEKLLVTALLTLALGVFAYCHVLEGNARRDHTLLVLLVTACVAFLLMLPWSAFVWRVIPDLATAIEFPWRLGEFLNIAAAGLFAAAIDRSLCHHANRGGSRSAKLVTLMAITVIGAGVSTWRADWIWSQVLRNPPMVHLDETANVDQIYRIYVSSGHLGAFAKLIGSELDTYQIGSTIGDGGGGAHLLRGRGVVNVIRESPRKLLISYTISGDGWVQIGQLYSPLWRIEPTSESSVSASLGSSAEGLIEVALVPGSHNVELVFDGGWPERYGVIVTFVSLMVVASGLALATLRRRVHLSTGPSSSGR